MSSQVTPESLEKPSFTRLRNYGEMPAEVVVRTKAMVCDYHNTPVYLSLIHI